MASTIRGISWITEIGIIISKKTYLSLISHSAQFLLTILLIIILSQYIGLIGIAISLFIGQIIRSLIESYYGQYAYPLNWDYLSIIKIIILTFFIGFTSEFMRYIYGNLITSFSYIIGIILLIYYIFNYHFSVNEQKKIFFYINNYKSFFNQKK